MKMDFSDLPDEAGTSWRPFSDKTLADAEVVVRQSFGSDVVPLLGKILRNPALADIRAQESGDIVYCNGEPVGFEALMPRRLYLRNRMYLGSVGSTMGLKPDVSPLVLLSLMKRNIAQRCGSILWFANTANATSVKMNRHLGIRGCGPCTWDEIRYAVIHPFSFAAMILRRKVLRRCQKKAPELALPIRDELVMRTGALEIRRMVKFDVKMFDAFWCGYVKANKGLVSSRSAAELEWMFGDRLATGEDVLLVACEDGRVAGFTVLRSCQGGWWRIADLIASGNDETILGALLKGAKRFLRKRTGAALLTSRGFPESAMCVIGKYLPNKRPTGGNAFLWKFYDTENTRDVGDVANDANSWFFGPYDGDAEL